MSEYRCPSINPWNPTDRCRLADSDEHEDGHEGRLGDRVMFWDSSPISIPDDSPERYEKVDALEE